MTTLLKEETPAAGRGAAVPQAAAQRLVAAGEQVGETVRYTDADIAQFAAATLDRNPLHRNPAAARRAGFPGLIASGQQTSAMLMGLLATHFSRADDGVAREMLCLNVNFAFKAPVFAGPDVVLTWTVASAEWHDKLGGMLAQLDGRAQAVDSEVPQVVGRATILVKSATAA